MILIRDIIVMVVSAFAATIVSTIFWIFRWKGEFNRWPWE